MKKHSRILIFCTLGILLLSCDKEDAWDCVQKMGKETTELRSLSAFNEIYIEDKIDVILEPGGEYEAAVSFGKNILPDIITEVKDGQLFIRNISTCDMVRDLSKRPKIRLRFPEIRYIQYSGTGNISCADTLISNKLVFEQWDGSGNIDLLFSGDSLSILMHTGHGKINIAGNSDIAEYYSDATGPINAQKVKANSCLVNNSGVNDISVSSRDYLYAFIGGKGNIIYSGNPFIDVAGSGSGELIHQ